MVEELPPAALELKKVVQRSCVDGAYGSFVRLTALRDYLTAECIRGLLLAFYQNHTDSSPIREAYILVFTILALLNKGTYIRHFLCRPFLADIRLPFHNPDDWPSDCRHFFKAFCEAQWQFCVPDLEASKLFDTHFDDEAVLPIISKKQLRKGTNSSTFKIEVQPEYDRLAGGVSKTLILKRGDWRKYADNRIGAGRVHKVSGQNLRSEDLQRQRCRVLRERSGSLPTSNATTPCRPKYG